MMNIDIDHLSKKFITNEKGEKKSVVIPMDVFEQLLEDYKDLRDMANRIDEPLTSHEEFKKELKKDALL